MSRFLNRFPMEQKVVIANIWLVITNYCKCEQKIEVKLQVIICGLLLQNETFGLLLQMSEITKQKILICISNDLDC